MQIFYFSCLSCRSELEVDQNLRRKSCEFPYISQFVSVTKPLQINNKKENFRRDFHQGLNIRDLLLKKISYNKKLH